jgi:serine/threonine protein kinase
MRFTEDDTVVHVFDSFIEERAPGF